MLHSPLFSKLFRSGGDSRGRRSAQRRGAAALRLEALEDRSVLSAMAVVNLADGGPGSLRQAIDDANNAPGADVIEFAPELTGVIGLTSGELNITDDLTIDGPGEDYLTISGNGQSRVFDISDATVAIDGLTIADGRAVYDGTDDGGGGILANNSVLNLDHVVLENNRFEGGADFVRTGGGAIKANSSNLTLDHVTARNNEAVDLVFTGMGGAVYAFLSTLNVDHSTFEGNRSANHPDSGNAGGGGAIGSFGGQTVIGHSQFRGNQADGGNDRGFGGAVMGINGNQLVVDKSSFIGNAAVGEYAAGGAIAAYQGTSAAISNSRFAQNSAVGGVAQGGAIWFYRGFGATVTIDNSSIVNNWVSGEQAEGGGIYNGTDVGPPMVMTITKTNITANRAMGSGDGGSGVGGGVFNTRTINIDKSSNINGNKASTSHDNVFGNLTLLDDLLAV